MKQEVGVLRQRWDFNGMRILGLSLDLSSPLSSQASMPASNATILSFEFCFGAAHLFCCDAKAPRKSAARLLHRKALACTTCLFWAHEKLKLSRSLSARARLRLTTARESPTLATTILSRRTNATVAVAPELLSSPSTSPAHGHHMSHCAEAAGAG